VSSGSGSSLNIGYDSKGNLIYKSDAGTLVYDNGSPYQLAHVTPYSSNFPTEDQTIAYTSFGKISTISEGTNNAAFKYNSDKQRVKMAFTTNGPGFWTKYYFGGSYEKVVGAYTTTEYIWIGGDAYNAVAVAKIVDGGTPQVWGIFRDHLGSMTHVKNGSTIYEYSFDAWGRRRDKDNWSYTLSGAPALFANRGFTGHEHLTEFGLINMNGRLYDPLVGRFLSPDNYVQASGFTQSFNRYAYALNNPLIYTDPDGEFVFSLLASVIPGAQFLLPLAFSADIGWMQGGMRAFMQEQSFWSGAWKGGVVGAVGGGLGMIGGAGMSFAQNLSLGTGQGALVGGLDAALWGNDIGNGMLWGAAGGAVFTTLTSENFSNALKGEGFYTNENVFNNMMERGMNKDAMLEYFGFEGKYDPDHLLFDGGGDLGVTDPSSGEIFYNKKAFSGNFDKLRFTHDHEMWHRQRVLSGTFDKTGITSKIVHQEEFKNYIRNYKRQGLYPNHSMNDLGLRINGHGTALGLNPDKFMKYTGFIESPWWHVVYKIPRRW
jgi:RHS repeat-associated protein